MTSTLTPLTDFSDRLSPMVVKELRQGLRTRAFGSTMLFMHVLLVLITLITGSAQNTDDTRWMLDGLATLILCLVMPFRVSNALAEEVKMNTLDMLMLTRLSCGRIVFGKWASVALQSALIALSLMPYIVARYVFGGVDMMMEFSMLAMKWILGLVFAALLVLLSTMKQAWLRMIIVIVPLMFGGFGVLGIFFASSAGKTLFTDSLSLAGWLLAAAATLIAAGWAIFASLSMAASRIASPSAPLSGLKRFIHTASLLVLLLIYAFTSQWVFLVAAIIVLCVLTLDVMTEPLNTVPSAYVPWFKHGMMGRLALRLFSPGWASGFWLAGLMAALVGVVMYAKGGATDQLPYYVLACCTLCLMTALIQIFPTRHAEDLLPIFIGTFCVVYLLSGMLSGLGVFMARSSNEAPWLLAALPPAAVIGSSQVSAGAERESFLRMAMLCGSLWPLIMMFLSGRAWRKLRPVRELAQRMAS